MERFSNGTSKGPHPCAMGNVNSATTCGYTVMGKDTLSTHSPSAVEVVRVTRYTAAVLPKFVKVWTGECSTDAAPSPKSHR